MIAAPLRFTHRPTGLGIFGVALGHGRAFGLPGHQRLSFACAKADLTVGLGRMAAALQGGA